MTELKTTNYPMVSSNGDYFWLSIINLTRILSFFRTTPYLIERKP